MKLLLAELEYPDDFAKRLHIDPADVAADNDPGKHVLGRLHPIIGRERLLNAQHWLGERVVYRRWRVERRANGITFGRRQGS